MIILHFPQAQTAKEYAEAEVCPGKTVDPHQQQCPVCHAQGTMTRWGSYQREARIDGDKCSLQIQRLRCGQCGATHALLPDFLHPYRRYPLSLMQEVLILYLLAGLGFGRILAELSWRSPPRSTLREWVASLAWGAGFLLLDVLRRLAMALSPADELPPPPDKTSFHLDNSKNATFLQNALRFLQWGELLYARKKVISPQIDFSHHKLFAFLLHLLQLQGLAPRIFYNPALQTTPAAPF